MLASSLARTLADAYHSLFLDYHDSPESFLAALPDWDELLFEFVEAFCEPCSKDNSVRQNMIHWMTHNSNERIATWLSILNEMLDGGLNLNTAQEYLHYRHSTLSVYLEAPPRVAAVIKVPHCLERRGIDARAFDWTGVIVLPPSTPDAAYLMNMFTTRLEFYRITGQLRSRQAFDVARRMFLLATHLAIQMPILEGTEFVTMAAVGVYSLGYRAADLGLPPNFDILGEKGSNNLRAELNKEKEEKSAKQEKK
jgi:hypothetical protein